jgi:hypothetical protein
MKRSVTHVQLNFPRDSISEKGRVSYENFQRVYDYHIVRSVTNVLIGFLPDKNS